MSPATRSTSPHSRRTCPTSSTHARSAPPAPGPIPRGSPARPMSRPICAWWMRERGRRPRAAVASCSSRSTTRSIPAWPGTATTEASRWPTRRGSVTRGTAARPAGWASPSRCSSTGRGTPARTCSWSGTRIPRSRAWSTPWPFWEATASPPRAQVTGSGTWRRRPLAPWTRRSPNRAFPASW